MWCLFIARQPARSPARLCSPLIPIPIGHLSLVVVFFRHVLFFGVAALPNGLFPAASISLFFSFLTLHSPLYSLSSFFSFISSHLFYLFYPSLSLSFHPQTLSNISTSKTQYTLLLSARVSVHVCVSANVRLSVSVPVCQCSLLILNPPSYNGHTRWQCSAILSAAYGLYTLIRHKYFRLMRRGKGK